MSSDDFDTLLESVGSFGRYQKTRFYFMCIPACFLCSFTIFQMLFLVATPAHHCRLHENDTWPAGFNSTLAKENQCTLPWNKTESCSSHGYLYDKSEWESTITTEWNLVCDKSWKVMAIFSVGSAGGIVGLLLFSSAMDIFGRKPVFFVGVVWYTAFSLGYLLINNYPGLQALNFFKYFANSPSFQVPWLYGLELVGHEMHVFYLVCTAAAFAVACVFLSLVAYLARTWQQVLLACSLPSIVLIFGIYFTDESPRWLFATGKYSKCRTLVLKIARINSKLDDLDVKQLDSVIERHRTTLNEQRELRKRNRRHDVSLKNCFQNLVQGEGNFGVMLSLFSTRNIALKTLLTTLLFSVDGIVYYGLMLNIENLGGNQVLVFAITACVEIIAALAVGLVNYTGRILPMAFSTIISGLAAISTAVVPYEMTWVIIGLAVICKLGNTISFNVAYLMSCEVFPTVCRASAIGFASMISAILQIPTPMIVYTAVHMKMLPMIVFGVISIICGVTSLFLPETTNCHMNDSIEDSERQPVTLANFTNNLTGKALHAAKQRVRSKASESDLII